MKVEWCLLSLTVGHSTVPVHGGKSRGADTLA